MFGLDFWDVTDMAEDDGRVLRLAMGKKDEESLSG